MDEIKALEKEKSALYTEINIIDEKIKDILLQVKYQKAVETVSELFSKYVKNKTFDPKFVMYDPYERISYVINYDHDGVVIRTDNNFTWKYDDYYCRRYTTINVDGERIYGNYS